MNIAWQVEIDPFCRKVLERHWPDVPKYGDIRELRGDELEPVDLICGGFPCQPFSVAGKRRGKADDRYLWPEMFRIIKALRPRWVLGENVAGIVNMALDIVLSDLESEGYETATFVIPACAVGAPHRRERVFFVAHIVADTTGEGLEGGKWQELERTGKRFADGSWWSVESCLGGVLDGPADWLDGYRWPAPFGCDQYEWEPPRLAKGVPNRTARLKALGNAVVPQVVEVIGRAILEVEGRQST